jgi:guanosine-3',5'-bis(diphosphate) 3'-pyrophosphohydrolase
MSAPPSIETLKSELLEDLRRHSPKVDLSRAAEAFDYSRAAHGDQLRKSGVPYLSHPVATVHILVDLLDSHLDTAIACAALLHDTVEDTPITLADVRGRYGDEVAQLVDGVTKISGFTFDSAKSEQAENFRKMLLSMARDLRVIFIKLADRLHNMRTLEFLPPDKAQRIARETRDIYAPLAHRLGIARIKRELEDLALKTLDPPAYRELAEKVALRREHREGMLKRLEEPLLTRLAAAGLTADVATRPKHFYSIYQKMKSSARSFDQIFDLLGLRIVTVDKGDCYRALGVVHDLWIPVQDRFKDYIATPKTNLYQSLHTTVVVPGGEMVEIQIRTREMHRTAESGVAAHYVYKGGQLDAELDARLGGFVGQTADWQATASDEEYMEFLQTALYQDEVFVYTPRRELKRLPKGATPLDFAFLVHSEVGFHCVGARVNGALVPLRHALTNGDTVEVITSPSARPHSDWLKIVRTPSARTKIRHWLRAQYRNDAVALGKEMLERELKRQRLADRVDEAALLDAAQSAGVGDLESLYAKLGQGTLSLTQVMRRLAPELEQPGPFEKIKNVSAEVLRNLTRGKSEGVLLHGLDNVMLHFARCCQPVPGERVIGIVTHGRGVSVHQADCPNTFPDRVPPERRVEVDWNTRPDEVFPVRLIVYGSDRQGMLADITKAIAALKVNIRSAGMASEDKTARGVFLVEVPNLRKLQETLVAVQRVKGVSRVERQQQNTPKKGEGGAGRGDGADGRA